LAGRGLAEEWCGAELRVLATETIYAFVYRASQKVHELWRYLLRRRRTRR